MAEKFKIENAELPKWPTNFSGRVNDNNPHGYKTFCVKISDPELAFSILNFSAIFNLLYIIKLKRERVY